MTALQLIFPSYQATLYLVSTILQLPCLPPQINELQAESLRKNVTQNLVTDVTPNHAEDRRMVNDRPYGSLAGTPLDNVEEGYDQSCKKISDLYLKDQDHIIDLDLLRDLDHSW